MEFKMMTVQGNLTPLTLLFQFIGKIFEKGREDNLYYVSMSGTSILIAILEHMNEKDPLIIQNINHINTMYIEEMA